MFVRIVLLTSFVLVFLFASTRSAHAEHAPAAMWKAVPPPIDPDKSMSFGSLFDKLARSCHRAPFAMRERALRESTGGAVGQEPDTRLGVRSQGLSAVGASAAAVGAGGWLLSHRSGVSIVPRLFSGGGGLGISIRW
jgi:hypothetical protein